MRRYKLLIVGAGPAGIAPLFHMDAENILADYIDKGICIIERSNEIGIGKFKDYNISANTLCETFLEIFRNEDSDIFQEVQKKESYLRLISKDNSTSIKLTEAGLLYKDYSEIIQRKMIGSSNSDVFCESEVMEIKECNDGYCVKYQNLNSGKIFSVFGENILLNLGGEHRCEFKKHNAITAEYLLTIDIQDKVSKILSENRKIVLVGNSHSSMSIVSCIKNNNNFTDNHSIYILGRAPLRLYYKNEEQAKADGYIYDEKNDVCPVTQRINRYSGMREDSFFIAREIIGNQFENIKHFIVSDVEEESLFHEADVIIECTGYQSKMVPIYDIMGNPIHMAYNKGRILVDENFNIVTNDGKPLKRIFSYGLGIGILTGEEIGGEESFKGRIDGVWLYQHFVAPKILNIIEEYISE